MIDLDRYAARAAQVLGEEGLGTLRMWAFDDGSYRCPLLWHTAEGRDTATGVIFLQDWYPFADDTQNFQEQIEHVATHAGLNLTPDEFALLVAEPQTDPTLDPVFRSPTWHRRFQDGWVATNALWGLRPPGKKTGFLGITRHRVARQVWTLLVQDLLEDNPDLRVALCGAWARRTNAASQLESLGVLPANIEQRRHPQVWTTIERHS
jgi:hypothetical protein